MTVAKGGTGRSWPGPARSPDPRKPRNALEHLATGITVVTTVHEGVPYGMTANAFVSLDPPLVPIAADNRTRFHGKVSQSGHYGVSLLSEEQGKSSDHFAGRERQEAVEVVGGGRGRSRRQKRSWGGQEHGPVGPRSGR